MRARSAGFHIAVACGVLILPACPAAAPLGGGRPDLPVEGVITEPDWAARPSAEDVARFYPPVAQMLQLSGRAEVTCAVTIQGALTGCATVEETPIGLGFGDAALSLSALFKMKPRMVDGQPVTGGTVRIPIRFSTADNSAADAPAGSVGPDPAPTALALGQRLATLLNSEAERTGWAKTLLERLRENLGAAGLTSEQELALKAYADAAVASQQAQVEQAARHYAASAPEPLLAQIVTFMESPAGHRWLDASADLQKKRTAMQAAIGKRLVADARARLCAQITCLAGSTPLADQGPAGAGARKP